MEDLADTDYTHVKRVWKKFKMTNIGEYHNLYVQNDTLFLADVFENFRNVPLEI